MILADKIIELRKKSGMSQEELAGMMNVSRQSVSKWESAQAVPDLNKIIMLSQIFGVSTDFLLKDEMAMEEAEYVQTDAMSDEFVAHMVSMEEANAFLDLNEKQATPVALGIAMCVFSPVILILLGGLSELADSGISENVAGGLGVIALLLFVACGVAIMVTSSIRAARYEYLEKDVLDIAYGVSGMVKDRKEKYAETHTRELVLGIVLCVLSAVPLMATVMISEADIYGAIGVCLVLTFVAAGVFFICKSSFIWGGYQKLLEEGDYTREHKQENKKVETVVRIYWVLVTAAYLAYSFITFDWGRSWIVWPVAGVLSVVVRELTKVLKK